MSRNIFAKLTAMTTKKPKTPATAMRMTDVARLAGVSVMTVSRALKSDGVVANETRQRVMKVVEKLGYVPDLLAGSLSSKKSGFVSLLVPSLNNSHFAETVMAMKQVLEPAGLQVLLGFTNYQASEEERLIEWMLKRRPEAIVLTYDGHTPAARERLKQAGVPVIEIWETAVPAIDHVVGFSNRAAAVSITNAMIELGYTKIGYIGESSDRGTRGELRRRGFTEAMKKRNLDATRQIAYAPPPINMMQGREAFAALMNRWPDTEAVVCVSDPCAFGALTYCQSRGWAVPQKIAIAGFGAFEISACSVPSLSTLSVSGFDIGEQTGRLILRLRNGEHSSAEMAKIVVATKPVMRDSSVKR
jgi:LacI family transcriptional regulator, gluconate utilization system Gnt-I transcriptional repressor